MSDYSTLELDVSRAGLAVVLLNRPDKRNAMNALVIEELADVFDALSKSPEVRLVLLRGAGATFSAGADLEWMRAAADYTRDQNEEDALALAEMLRKLYSMPQTTIAMVHGAAIGGGAGLVSACDIAIAHRDTTFQFSEVRLGLTPATISPFVIEAIGPRWARALFVSADRFDTEFAEKIGLVHYAVADETEMEETAERLARLVFGAAPGAIADAKDLVADFTGEIIDASLSHKTAKRIAARRASAEGREGIAAFLSKRKPNWAN
ncbi:MAG: enoyl-CoA hydratase-related protein [Pseudomonadota bacterium]